MTCLSLRSYNKLKHFSNHFVVLRPKFLLRCAFWLCIVFVVFFIVAYFAVFMSIKSVGSVHISRGPRCWSSTGFQQPGFCRRWCELGLASVSFQPERAFRPCLRRRYSKCASHRWSSCPWQLHSRRSKASAKRWCEVTGTLKISISTNVTSSASTSTLC